MSRHDTVFKLVRTGGKARHGKGPGEMSTLAMAGFVLAILVPPAGILVSAIALRQVRREHLRGRDLAIAGIIVGAAITGSFLVGLLAYGILHLLFYRYY